MRFSKTTTKWLPVLAAVIALPMLAGAANADEGRGRDRSREARGGSGAHQRDVQVVRRDRSGGSDDKIGFRIVLGDSGRDYSRDRSRDDGRDYGKYDRRDRSDRDWKHRGHGKPTQAITQRVLVKPGHYETVWVEPVRATRYDACGNAYTVIIRPGYHKQVWCPPVYETRTVQTHPGRGHAYGHAKRGGSDYDRSDRGRSHSHGSGVGVIIEGNFEF